MFFYCCARCNTKHLDLMDLTNVVSLTLVYLLLPPPSTSLFVDVTFFLCVAF